MNIMKLWRMLEKVMKHIKDVVNAVKVMEKSDEHEVAVHVKKTFFPKKKLNKHKVL